MPNGFGNTIENFIVVEPFVIHSDCCDEIILYLISLDLHQHFNNQLCATGDSRYCEVGHLEVFIHDGVYKSIEYRAQAGRGYKLPHIKNYDHVQRSDN